MNANHLKAEDRGRATVMGLIGLVCWLVAAWAPRVSGQAAVWVSAGSWGANPVTNRSITITPIALNPGGGVLASYDAQTLVTDSTGAFWISNVVAGTYQATIHGPPATTVHFFYVDATNAVQLAGSNTVASARATWPPDSVAWSANASDQRYAFKGDIASLNPYALTNGDTRSISFAADLTVATGLTNSGAASFANGVLVITPDGNIIISGATGASQLGDVEVSGYLHLLSQTWYPTNAPMVADIGGTPGVSTNFTAANVGGVLSVYWTDGTNVFSKQLAP